MIYLYGVEKLTDFAEWFFSLGEHIDCLLPRDEYTDEEYAASKEEAAYNRKRRNLGGLSQTQKVDASGSVRSQKRTLCDARCRGYRSRQFIWGAVGVLAASILVGAIFLGIKTFPGRRRSNAAFASSGSFEPGNLYENQFGIKISKGLLLRDVAHSGEYVTLGGSFVTQAAKQEPQEDKGIRYSKELFHALPDGAATFSVPKHQGGGFVYVSNSEEDNGMGGVGALYFDRDGNVVDYKMLLKETTRNCSGGKTPWNTWISCEEEKEVGQCFEVDPFGLKAPQETVLGGSGGAFEAVAVDNRDANKPLFYVTHDSSNGELRQFRPDTDVMRQALKTNDFSKVLITSGDMKYLVLEPDADDETKGSFVWTDSLDEGRKSAQTNHRYSEGIEFRDGILYFVCKVKRHMFALDMKRNRYSRSSTVAQMFGGGPDQILIPSFPPPSLNGRKKRSTLSSDIMYFTEDPDSSNNDQRAGIHGLSLSSKNSFTLLESQRQIGETSGVAFSPDGRFLLFAYQHEGTLFIAQREDGLPFLGHSLNLKYHPSTILEGNIIRRLTTFF